MTHNITEVSQLPGFYSPIDTLACSPVRWEGAGDEAIVWTDIMTGLDSVFVSIERH